MKSTATIEALIILFFEVPGWTATPLMRTFACAASGGDVVFQERTTILPTYAPQTMFVRGQGVYLFDADGRRYLDFASGISVCNLGHCHPTVTAAIQKQAAELVHISNLYYNPVTPMLAEKLVSKCFDGAVFFANSGAEANEGLIKLARKYGSRTGRHEIISMENSFHGRTLATLAATGRAKYRKGFEPDMPGFKQVPFNDFDALAAAVTDKTCGILLEIVQGEGGILPADTEYLNKVRALCDEKDILMLCDEVQCGMGRTGTLFAWQGAGVEPDAFSMAKALANGLPMGGFIVKRKFTDVLTVGTHASTFGGTPLVSAAALAVQQVFDEEIAVGEVPFEALTLQAGRLRWHAEPAEGRPVPPPAEAALKPSEIDTCEQLYLTGLHLEQYRHATWSAKEYYEEALRRDPSDVRNNNALGLWYLRRGTPFPHGGKGPAAAQSQPLRRRTALQPGAVPALAGKDRRGLRLVLQGDLECGLAGCGLVRLRADQQLTGAPGRRPGGTGPRPRAQLA